MAPLSTAAISHFLHPAHNLNQLITNTSYLCDGCKVPGTGSRFTCTICSFDLHDYCAKCPTRLTSTTNHQHPMSLVVHKPQPDHTKSCQICHNPIKGLAYVCKDCNFWVHPLCVSGNQGRNQQHTVPSGTGAAFAAASLDIGQQVGVGLGTNWLYDQLKEEHNQVPSAGTNASGAGQVPSDPVDSNTVGIDEVDSAPADSNTFGVDEDDGVASAPVDSNTVGIDEVASAPADSNTFGVDEDDGGFFHALKSGFKSFFESSMDK